MKISQPLLMQKLTIAAEKIISKQEAKYFAQETIEAHLRKAPRTNPLKSSVDDLEASTANKKRKIEYIVDLPSFISINFNGNGPLTYIKRIHDELEKRSKKNGIVMAAFTNGKGMHTLHTWIQGLAKRGLLAIAICNGGPNGVVPFNGTKGVFGTNPIAYGIPGRKGEIFCVDMATSEIPFFEIMDAYKNKATLPEHSAVDNVGEYTTDPKKALDFSLSKIDPISNLLPIGGGYKGYYLVYLFEILTSALIGTPSSPEMTTDFIPEEHGSIIMVFDPKSMGTEKTFYKSISKIHGVLKKQIPKKGATIPIPGESNNKRLSKSLNTDIEVDEKLLEKLNNLGKAR